MHDASRPGLALAERVFSSDALGPVRILANDEGVVAIYFEKHRRARAHAARVIGAEILHDVIGHAERELEEYSRGERQVFTMRLSQIGTTFQRAVWDALAAIPFGETRTYSEVAAAIGSPRAVRAVGTAIGSNPLSVVVPCHRVIGIRGELTGYAGGIERKRWLLDHERRVFARAEPAARGA